MLARRGDARVGWPPLKCGGRPGWKTCEPTTSRVALEQDRRAPACRSARRDSRRRVGAVVVGSHLPSKRDAFARPDVHADRRPDGSLRRDPSTDVSITQRTSRWLRTNDLQPIRQYPRGTEPLEHGSRRRPAGPVPDLEYKDRQLGRQGRAVVRNHRLRSHWLDRVRQHPGRVEVGGVPLSSCYELRRYVSTARTRR
jgi:hypothetical protein